MILSFQTTDLSCFYSRLASKGFSDIAAMSVMLYTVESSLAQILLNSARVDKKSTSSSDA